MTSSPLDFDSAHLSIVILIGGTSLLLATFFLNTFVLMPLGYLEEKLIPHTTRLVSRDRPLRIAGWVIFLFCLVSYLCVALISQRLEMSHQRWLFVSWIIFFGISLDIFRNSWQRLLHFLNPTFLVSQLSKQAEQAIRDQHQDVLLNDLDALAEVALRSIEKSKLSLITHALQTFPPLLKTYFDSSKSIGHASRHIEPEKNSPKGDESNFIVFYLLQRFELIHDRALRERQETASRQMIMIMGKIILHCAQLDLSGVAFPTHFLTKFGLKAQQHHFDEVAVLTTSTLLEVAKTLLTTLDVTDAELKDPFQAIINGLTAIAKGTFKKQKNGNIKVLIQPLLDIKAFFQTEKMRQHRETPRILEHIDQVLEEFAVLEQVMQTIPPIPDVGSTEDA